VLASSSSGSRGGGELYLKSLAHGLVARSHDVLTLVSSGEQMDELAATFRSEGLQVQRFGYTSTYLRRLRTVGTLLDVRQRLAVANLFKSLAPDIVHINQQCVEDGLDLLLAGRSSGLPAVSTVHVTRSMSALGAVAGRARDLIARHTIKRARIPLIGISHVSANDLATFVAGPKSLPTEINEGRGSSLAPSALQNSPVGIPVYCVPNGVPIPVARERAALRLAWGIPADAIVLGIVARIEQQKNPLFIIRLLAQLPPHVHLVWVGDGRMRGEMEAAIASSNISHRIHLDGWQSDGAGRIAGFDIFVLPSLYEGLPLALLEAMSLEMPCVVSDVDGTRDAIVHGTSGFLCPVNDVDVWRRTLSPLIESLSLRSSVGSAARNRHRTEFSIDQMAQKTAAVYEQVMLHFKHPVIR
jgi:glycosyltransferase involved in cell wall biosynthesis